MEEELQKRNTDCVYFLASPLTCKKGAECDYRHSEMARLNPRDCWFWLSGTCLNPTCAFRHPPLEKPAEASSESGPAPSQPPQQSNKTSVPCYFHFQGYCSKGEKCTFSHSPDVSSIPTAKTLKPPPPTNNSVVHPADSNNKTLSGTKAASVPAPKAQNNIPLATHQKPSVPKDVVPKSSSLQISAPHGDPAGVLESSDTLLPSESYNEAGSYMGAADQDSEENIDGHVEPEERWESSPGFDVLVDNDEEAEDQNLCYENEQEYMVSLNREEGRELDSNLPFVEYELEERQVEYERRLGSRERRGVDLRDHLRKRRAIDDGEPPLERSMRRRHHDESLPRRDRSRERPYKHGLSERLRGRLASEVGGRNGSDYVIPSRHSPYDRAPRLHHRERRGVPRRPQPPFIPSERDFVPSELRRKPVGRERSVEVSGEFSGPKSLAQIREEKRRVVERNGHYNEDRDDDDMGVIESANFDGPKPLNEILKEKKKLSSFVEYNNGSSN
ncbi:unnamed protein product [Linum trigynum]|uniref:C3H1-type domain-containing protein n=1 Tax=Linum trigynum TaxID=586398 RepID=A0AAV2CTX6_9ROSI